MAIGAAHDSLYVGGEINGDPVAWELLGLMPADVSSNGGFSWIYHLFGTFDPSIVETNDKSWEGPNSEATPDQTCVYTCTLD